MGVIFNRVFFVLNVWNSLHPPVCTINRLHVAPRPCRPSTGAARTQRSASWGFTVGHPLSCGSKNLEQHPIQLPGVSHVPVVAKLISGQKPNLEPVCKSRSESTWQKQLSVMVVKMSELSAVHDSSSYATSLQGYKKIYIYHLYTYTSRITQLA